MEQGKLPTKLPDINDARNLLIELPSVKEKIEQLKNRLTNMGMEI